MSLSSNSLVCACRAADEELWLEDRLSEIGGGELFVRYKRVLDYVDDISLACERELEPAKGSCGSDGVQTETPN
jgi:hypothetical protein